MILQFEDVYQTVQKKIGPYKTRIGSHRHIGAFFYADRILILTVKY